MGGLGMFLFLLTFGPELFYATKMNTASQKTWSFVKALNPFQNCFKSGASKPRKDSSLGGDEVDHEREGIKGHDGDDIPELLENGKKPNEKGETDRRRRI